MTFQIEISSGAQLLKNNKESIGEFKSGDEISKILDRDEVANYDQYNLSLNPHELAKNMDRSVDFSVTTKKSQQLNLTNYFLEKSEMPNLVNKNDDEPPTHEIIENFF